MAEDIPGSGDTGGWDRDNGEKILRGVEEDRKDDREAAEKEAGRYEAARRELEAQADGEADKIGDELTGDIQEKDITDEYFPPERQTPKKPD
ncbi:hypothetical protein KY385_01440 [Candidatus Parcubacteria bacterium]|nr:hypothetical protein [Candidatus Parcubacteria bacterium]